MANERFARSVQVSADREKDDFYPTPPEATQALLAVEDFTGPIWECACGDGAISQVLAAAGHTVISTDLVDRGYGTPHIDFLMEYAPQAQNIVTNPPFKLAQDFTEHALSLTGGYPGISKVAIFARLQWLESKRRKQFFQHTPLARVWVFSERVRMQRAGDKTVSDKGMMAFAWFVWQHGHDFPPTLGWL